MKSYPAPFTSCDLMTRQCQIMYILVNPSSTALDTAILSFTGTYVCLFYLFVLLLYAPSQQLWLCRDGHFTLPHFFPGQP